MVARLLPVLAVVALLEAVATDPPRLDSAQAAPAHDDHVLRNRSPAFPSRRQVAAARRFAGRRAGVVSFAVIDSRGRLRGLHVHRRYRSASVTKAMLLVAYLRRLAAHRGRLTGATRGILGPMIRFSDNDSADAIYGIVGDGGLQQLGRRAGMTRLKTAGAWSETWITAADQARFFRRIRRLTPRRYRHYALGLLASVVGPQRWGIPRAAPRGFRVYLKGGWRPEGSRNLVHQAALVERGRLHVPIAVLTTEDPGHPYGTRTVERIAARLLRGAGRHPLAKRRAP